MYVLQVRVEITDSTNHDGFEEAEFAHELRAIIGRQLDFLQFYSNWNIITKTSVRKEGDDE